MNEATVDFSANDLVASEAPTTLAPANFLQHFTDTRPIIVTTPPIDHRIQCTAITGDIVTALGTLVQRGGVATFTVHATKAWIEKQPGKRKAAKVSKDTFATILDHITSPDVRAPLENLPYGRWEHERFALLCALRLVVVLPPCGFSNLPFARVTVSSTVSGATACPPHTSGAPVPGASTTRLPDLGSDPGRLGSGPAPDAGATGAATTSLAAAPTPGLGGPAALQTAQPPLATTDAPTRAEFTQLEATLAAGLNSIRDMISTTGTQQPAANGRPGGPGNSAAAAPAPDLSTELLSAIEAVVRGKRARAADGPAGPAAGPIDLGGA